LELDGLTQPRHGSDSDRARAWVSPQQIANEEIAPMKILQVLVDYQPYNEVATRAFLFFGRELVEGFGQDLVGRPIPNLVNDVLLDFR